YDSFFFQAEDGIRDATVTGVQTCALPICKDVGQRSPCEVQRLCVGGSRDSRKPRRDLARQRLGHSQRQYAKLWQQSRRSDRLPEIGRASCRERGEDWAVAGARIRKVYNER